MRVSGLCVWDLGRIACSLQAHLMNLHFHRLRPVAERGSVRSMLVSRGRRHPVPEKVSQLDID